MSGCFSFLSTAGCSRRQWRALPHRKAFEGDKQHVGDLLCRRGGVGDLAPCGVLQVDSLPTHLIQSPLLSA